MEKILDRRILNGGIQYFLKWVGYPDEENSWEPEGNLDCEDLVKEFESLEKKKRQEEKNKIQKKRLGRAPNPILSNSTITSDVSSVAGPSEERRYVSSSTILGERSIQKIIHKNVADKLLDDETQDDEFEKLCKATVVSLRAGKNPDKIISSSFINGKLMFLLKWQNTNKANIILASDANMICPEVVIAYYER